MSITGDSRKTILPKNPVRKTVVTDERGEVIRETSVFLSTRGIDFVKTMRPWAKLACVLNDAERALLWELAYNMSYADDKGEGQIAFMLRGQKETLMETMNLSMSSINHAISGLVKHGIIRRVSQGMYQVNPFIIGRGRQKNLFKLQQNYGIGDDTIADEIVKNELYECAKEEIERHGV